MNDWPPDCAKLTLGNAVFQTFMTLLGEDVSSDVVVKARREETVEDGKRLDLVLETSDMVVGIENKVNHELNNDLAAYRRHLDMLANGRDVYPVVLSRYPIPAGQRVANWHFVTYDPFCAKLQRIDFGPARIGNKYVMFLDDFIISIVKPNQRGVMDSQRLEFFRQHQAETETLLKEVAALKADMRHKINALWESIPAATLATRVPVQNGLWRSEEKLIDLIWNKVDIASDLVLVVDVLIEPAGWTILFRNERRDQSKAEQWLKQRGIESYRISNEESWRAIIVDPAAPGYDADPVQVREWVMKYLTQVLPQ